MQKEMLRIGIVFILACLMLTCSEESTTVPKTINVHFSDTIYFEIDSVTAHYSQVSYWESKDRLDKYLILFNSRLPAIQFYNWETRQLDFKIHLAKEAPNGIPNASSVYVHTLDSIFVISAYQYKFFQINRAGEVVNTISLLPDDVVFDSKNTKPTRTTADALFALPYARIGSPMFKKGDWIYMPCVTQIPFFTENKRLFEKGKSLLGVNFKTGDIKFHLDYPSPYKIPNPNYPPQFTQVIIADMPGTENVVASFPADHNIQVYNIDNELQVEHPVKSIKLKSIPPMNSLEMDVAMHSNHYMNNGYYERIVTDPYRGLIYRIVKHADKENPYVFGENNSNYRGIFSLIIADVNFRVVDEINLTEYGFTNVNTFCTPEALYFQFGYSTEDEIAFRKVVFRFSDSSFK